MSQSGSDLFVKACADYLASYFHVANPKIRTRCEETCGYAPRCRYLACYMPMRDQINIKSGSAQGYIVGHEYGHALDEKKLIKYSGDVELPALAVEEWYAENINEGTCKICGYPLFVSDDTPIGTRVLCPNCGAIYRATPRAPYQYNMVQ